MTNHEAYRLGWVYGRIEVDLAPDYDATGNKCERAAERPISGMAAILAAAHKSSIMNETLDYDIGQALDEVSDSILPEGGAEPILPLPLQGSWHLGRIKGRTRVLTERFKLAERRKAKGVTQEQLALELDVTQSMVSQWERGISTPSGKMYARIVELLDDRPADTHGGIDTEANSP